MTNQQQPPSSRCCRPSDRRRKILSEELSVPLVSNFFPLERYYEAADKVYQSYRKAYQQATAMPQTTTTTTRTTTTKPLPPVDPVIDAAIDDAYVYGKRYCTFCLEALPEHNYYGTVKYKKLQRQHTQQISVVLTQLEQEIGVLMDEYEKIKQEFAAAEHQRRLQVQKRLEAQRRAEEERRQQARFAAWQERIEAQKRDDDQQQQQQQGRDSVIDVEASALQKLQMLLPSPPKTPSKGEDRSGDDKLRIGKPGTRYRLDSSSSEEEEEAEYEGSALPPPLLPPSTDAAHAAAAATGSSVDNASNIPPPPSYNQALAAKYHDTLWDPTTTTNGDGLRIQGPTTATTTTTIDQKRRPRPFQQPPKPNIPLRELQIQYEQDYMRYQRAGRIRITPIDTYQGRLSASTNGCTVISALVAAHHLRNGHQGGVTDAQIVQVIDQQCGPLLRQIRSKLGLGGHALIIPSDVHDHLVDCKLLQQEKFLGAAGGNILDPDHMGEFLKLLSVGGDNGKHADCPAAATLFFREHVVSLVKHVGATTGATYDLVDSMPNVSHNGSSKATRTHCQDLESLQVLLNWYASRKFSPSHCAYVDRNKWNDSMADLDPRVFQGFVWGDPPKQ